MPARQEKAKMKEDVEAQPVETRRFALLFQLEDVAVNGRKLAFDALRETLGDKVNIPLFSRYALQAPLSQAINDLAQAVGQRGEDLVEKVTQALSARYSAGELKLEVGLAKIVQKALEMNIALGVITSLPENLADEVFAKTGLKDKGAQLFVYKETERVFPGPDIWLKTAKAMSMKARNCGVVAGNMVSCKSALSADMRCVAVYDDFTAFQDFSGAHMVLENLQDSRPDEVLNALFLLSVKG